MTTIKHKWTHDHCMKGIYFSFFFFFHSCIDHVFSSSKNEIKILQNVITLLQIALLVRKLFKLPMSHITHWLTCSMCVLNAHTHTYIQIDITKRKGVLF